MGTTIVATEANTAPMATSIPTAIVSSIANGKFLLWHNDPCFAHRFPPTAQHKIPFVRVLLILRIIDVCYLLMVALYCSVTGRL